jgi:hypothetical protein
VIFGPFLLLFLWGLYWCPSHLHSYMSCENGICVVFGLESFKFFLVIYPPAVFRLECRTLKWSWKLHIGPSKAQNGRQVDMVALIHLTPFRALRHQSNEKPCLCPQQLAPPRWFPLETAVPTIGLCLLRNELPLCWSIAHRAYLNAAQPTLPDQVSRHRSNCLHT